ncbi:uncharacterized protein LOC143911566 isoform X2 [Arctopsyche grandis]|uniref:uncharacterized protein LOC143911566 isoform X2 n=1 Tax=Arctopsyche grandis TaxID=121162 RepID=UPI00406D6411
MYARRLLLLLLLTPPLMAAAPLLVADVEPSIQDLVDEESSNSNLKNSARLNRLFYPDDSYSKEPSIPLDFMFDLDQIRTNEIDNSRSEEKRSGLRAAMVARGGRGVKLRTGWQVGGLPLTVLSGPEYENSYVSRRSQPVPPSAYLVRRGPMHGQIKPVSGAPYSPGVLSNVEDYFKGLRDSLTGLADDQQIQQFGASRMSPMTADTFLHSGVPLRPSDKVRLFVQDPGPLALRGANGHDPALLWTGIGRR